MTELLFNLELAAKIYINKEVSEKVFLVSGTKRWT
jgi:hypothetical protein